VIPPAVARRPLSLVAAAVAAMAVALGAGAALWLHRPATTTSAPALNAPVQFAAGARPAPDFRLHDLAAGGPLTLRSLRGHVVLLTFLDSHCTNLCPIVGHELAVVERRLPAADRPVVVAVSVNPADSPASVAEAVHKYGWVGAWHWAGGVHAGLAPVWKRYGIQVEPTTNDIAHGEAVYVIDQRGDERAAYVPPFPPGQLASDVRTLSGGGRGG
jgi:cytochrome oxidase Cu insertion factor (SCO1/SenC/PrrC family)